MTDDTFFPQMKALRKKKKNDFINEPRSAENFSPVYEENEEDQEAFQIIKMVLIF